MNLRHRRGGLPLSPVIAAAYIPAIPRADPTPPNEAVPRARTAARFGNCHGVVRVMEIESNAGEAVGAAAARRQRRALLGGGERRLRGQEAGLVSAGRPRKKSTAYGSRTRSANRSWTVRPVARRTTSPLSAAMTRAW